MKRILIFSHSMELGGAEKALLGLLESLRPEDCRVDLFLMRHKGELLPFLPPHVRLLPELPAYASMAVPAAEAVRRGQLPVLFGRWRGKKAAERFVHRNGVTGDCMADLLYSHRDTVRYMPPVGEGTYDLAISYLTPHYYVAARTSAVRKAAWIHTDYGAVRTDVPEEERMWGAYDRIVAVSSASADSFRAVFPSLASRVCVMENRLPLGYMAGMADAFDAAGEMPDDGSVRLLSVGRFCEAKNFDSVPDICRRIREAGMKVTWYLIGYGSDEPLIRQRIRESGMERYVIILGKKDNPYPYMKACDVYVQPSRYEGRCVAVQEAQWLGKPVVITDYPSSASQLTNGTDGWIVPRDNAACAEALASLLESPERLAAVSRRGSAADVPPADLSFLTEA